MTNLWRCLCRSGCDCGALSCGNCFFAVFAASSASVALVLVWETATYGELAGLAAPTHKYTGIRTCIHIQEKTHALLVCCLVALVCMWKYVCSVVNESTTKNGRNVFCFCFAPSVGCRLFWSFAVHTHTCKFQRTHTHDRRSINFDICNFHLSAIVSVERNQILIKAVVYSTEYFFFFCSGFSYTFRIYL